MAVGGGGAKQDDFQPHPVMDQLPGVEYCITSPPNWRTHWFSSLVHRFIRCLNRFFVCLFWCILGVSKRANSVKDRSFLFWMHFRCFFFHGLLMKCVILMRRSCIWWCCVKLLVSVSDALFYSASSIIGVHFLWSIGQIHCLGHFLRGRIWWSCMLISVLI